MSEQLRRKRSRTPSNLRLTHQPPHPGRLLPPGRIVAGRDTATAPRPMLERVPFRYGHSLLP